MAATLQYNGYAVPRTVHLAKLPLAIAHAHPRDEHVVFDEGPHTYYVKGTCEGYTSVTTFIHIFFPVFDESSAIEGLLSRADFPLGSKYAKKYAHIVAPDGERLPDDKARVAIAEEWERIRNEASTLGTAFHADCERYLNAPPALVVAERAAVVAASIPGEDAEQVQSRWAAAAEGSERLVGEALGDADAAHAQFDLTLRTPDTVEFGYFTAYAERMRAQGYVPYRTEAIVWDEDLRLVGSVDMQWILESDLREGRRRIHLADWKRSKEIRTDSRYGEGIGPLEHLPDCNYAHYRLQLNLYRHLLETHYGCEITHMTIVVCHPNNDACMEYPVPRMQKEVDDMLAVRRAQLSVGMADHDVPDAMEEGRIAP